MIHTGSGNLLDSTTEAVVNTVNCVGVMGKGIALQFKKAWPEMFSAYAKAAKAGEVVPGRMHVYETGQLVGIRWIVNFPTKRHWRGRSQMADIESGLQDLVHVVRKRGIRSISIPPLGAGLGGLDWSQVRPRIEAAFRGLADVDVWLWEPGHTPPPRGRPVRTRRPAMTQARALILALMERYKVMDHAVTHLEVQKLAYLLQSAGAPLELRFAAETYGPYADGLYHLLQGLEGHHVHGLDDRSPWKVIEVEPGSAAEARQFLEGDDVANGRFERVGALIEGLETPYGLELLASAHWVATEDPPARVDADRCVELVQGWNERKRRVLRQEHIRLAWKRLEECGFLEG